MSGLSVTLRQAVGTPVVSTKFTAMEDYTRYGLAVPPVQQSFMQRGMVAQPHLPGVISALEQVYNHSRGLPAASIGDRAQTVAWITKELSPEAVGGKFASWIRELVSSGSKQTVPANEARLKPCADCPGPEPLYHHLTADQTSPEDWVAPWILSSPEAVQFNHLAIQELLRHMDWSRVDAVFVPTLRADGTPVPIMDPDYPGHVHPDNAVLVRTALFVNGQLNSFQRYTIVQLILSAGGGSTKQVPVGLARFPESRQSKSEL